MFVPYKMTLGLLPNGHKDFEINSLEEEPKILTEINDLVENSREPLWSVSLPAKQFAEIMQQFSPHHMRVRKLFEEHFDIYQKRDREFLGPKIARREERQDGTTLITYQSGKTKTVLQPYSDARHPWAKQILEKGLDLPPHTAEALQKAMPQLVAINTNSKEQPPEGIHLYNGMNFVFSLDAIPGVIFKRANCGWASLNGDPEKGNLATADRFEKMAKAQFVCQALNLDFLVVPHARKIEVEYEGKTYLFIAEERLHVDTNRSLQEECYRKFTSSMDSLVEQLIRFIQETEMSDISWRNLPLFNDNVAKVGLIDLDRIDTSVILGLLGNGKEPERGLLNCLFSEKQINAVVEAARSYDVDQKGDKMKQQRLKEIQRDADLQEFYIQKELLKDPRRLIDIDHWTQGEWNKLGLNLDETAEIDKPKSENQEAGFQPITMREAVKDVVQAINQSIQTASEPASVKGIRGVHYNMQECYNEAHYEKRGNEEVALLSRLSDYGRWLGLPEGDYSQMSYEERGKFLWLDRIARALIEGGYLHSYQKDGENYNFQA